LQHLKPGSTTIVLVSGLSCGIHLSPAFDLTRSRAKKQQTSRLGDNRLACRCRLSIVSSKFFAESPDSLCSGERLRLLHQSRCSPESATANTWSSLMKRRAISGWRLSHSLQLQLFSLTPVCVRTSATACVGNR